MASPHRLGNRRARAFQYLPLVDQFADRRAPLLPKVLGDLPQQFVRAVALHCDRQHRAR